MDTLKVTIDVEESTISVFNNGRGIPIEIHEREKIYVSELIFGHLLSSSNYDDNEKKLTGGRNGYGAKLANIYSHEFTVETADKNTQQKYKQTWTDNMGKCGKPMITKNPKSEEYTQITFKPDLKRFGMDKIDEDTASLLRKRVYNMAGVVKDIKVFLNDERFKIKNLSKSETSGGPAQPKPTVIHGQAGSRWGIAFAVSDGSFQHVSFANSISTSKRGTHAQTYSAGFKIRKQTSSIGGLHGKRLLGLTKLSDANNASTKHAKDCSLILTEGDSAKALAVGGLGVVGRDNSGVFPLRGKLFNVHKAKHDQIMKNDEIQNIKKIMGLQRNKDYEPSIRQDYDYD
ncbi:hypothetical protein GALMADRAFT_149171 [Galerina marginata CBS 339.88]|uniref:DNA topoisomerase (ATP-hydrolyzing) n=1 Tax=Galerina marginata (strain CBS 339.88) TaxID=685588 RepID=A0A067SDS9_GALM3|nr:hypothetical protein GALMADRAFT_149171 [Galerina marginata CBS 339.88]